jgi:hypothetical protein
MCIEGRPAAVSGPTDKAALAQGGVHTRGDVHEFGDRDVTCGGDPEMRTDEGWVQAEGGEVQGLAPRMGTGREGDEQAGMEADSQDE